MHIYDISTLKKCIAYDEAESNWMFGLFQHVEVVVFQNKATRLFPNFNPSIKPPANNNSGLRNFEYK